MQAELRRKEIVSPGRIPPNLPQPAPISRSSTRTRHVSRLSAGTGPMTQKSLHSSGTLSNPSSQVSSPIKSPGFGAVPSGMNLSGFQSPGSTQSIQSRSGAPRTILPPIAPSGTSLPGPGHWPSPFQTHNEQLGR